MNTTSGVVSYLRWGSREPDLVLLHGGGQNAHTWDTFVMAVDRTALAVDLPGHGRSAWRENRDYSPGSNALAVAQVVEQVAPRARAVVGMSLGGLTALRLAALRPDLVRAVVLVDITPAMPRIAGDSNPPPTPVGLLAGPRSFESWDAMLDAAHTHLPQRDRASLVPGVRHNARRLDDGSWAWRYDRLVADDGSRPDHSPLWDDLAALTVDVLFVRGGRSPIVSDDAVAELRRRCPSARVEVVAQSGHAIQNDAPVELAGLVGDFLR
jgi:pimeloyl-ACP methyl ester carboxylesterase